ncbi:MAG: hypothetical protein AVDCRST_MAG88-3153 [uncultured Thermomicrobiales bacterium]|uniref:Uncharacterized protein n=1 Tax=uncultured Thermomicrobiales bacterium TaxID=1645740 RepID=A0A6J4VJT9_9BACT|nr:MAG: hypothetical protein AVDCRST_MAG88-3153 [uncultured Thermomicrobiales bacterium]
MRVRISILAVVLLLLPVAAADARSSFCSPTGDYCTSVQKKRSDVLLRVATFSFRGSVRICVRAPDGAATCKRFRLLRGRAGIYASTKSWKRHFPNLGRGVYRVRWQVAGANLGPRLSFRR